MVKSVSAMKIRTDCRNIRWDVPCAPHKSEGVHCENCPYYDPVGERVLIIKLDALGDVLRTTCILPALREEYAKAQVTWITMAEALPLLENNPYVDRRLAYGADALAALGVEEFDLVLSLDAAPRTAALASIARAKAKRGFGLDSFGRVFPFTPEAESWLLMGLFDDVKKRNSRTYQEIVLGICGFTGRHQEIVVRLTDEEKEFARRFAMEKGLCAGESGGSDAPRVVGVNTGAGRRWPMKQWPVDRCAELIRRLASDGVRVLLFGGTDEIGRNRRIKDVVGEQLIDTGCNNSLREFMALIGLCDLLVTSDTLGLHVALGLGKEVVGLFGPTSADEIDVYGRGIKIVPDVDCVCCYLRKCSRTPSCMETIDVDFVYSAVIRLLGRE